MDLNVTFGNRNGNLSADSSVGNNSSNNEQLVTTATGTAAVAQKIQVLRKQIKLMSERRIKARKDDSKAETRVKESISKIFQSVKSKSTINISKAYDTIADIKVIKGQTPLEQDLSIQNNRVMNILDRAIEKMEILVYLPTLLKNNGCILKQFFSMDEVQFIMYTCYPYTSLIIERDFDYQKIASIENKIAKLTGHDNRSKIDPTLRASFTSARLSNVRDSYTNNQMKDVMPSEKIDPMMSKVVEIIFKNVKLREAIQNKRIKLHDETAETFLNVWKVLREAAIRRFSLTAKEDTDKENNLRRLYKSNKDCLAKIEHTTKELFRQKQILGKELQCRHSIIDNYNNSIEKMRAKFNEELKKKIATSEKKMAEETVKSEAKRAEMQEELQKLRESYENILRENLKAEKLMRKKKYKIESQLASWLGKYDNDVGERQAEYDEISELYEEELREMTDLKEKFDAQEEEYNLLMAEKEAEELEILEEMVQDFLLNHSARIIQRAYRAYKARKLAKKLAKKKGKKGAKGFKIPALVTPPPIQEQQTPTETQPSEHKIEQDVSQADIKDNDSY